MDILAGFIMALIYRTFIREQILPLEFCLFACICTRRGRDVNCCGCKRPWLLQWPVLPLGITTPPRDASQQEMLCAALPAHTADSQRSTRCVSPLWSSSSCPPPPACLHFRHSALPTAEEMGRNCYLGFTAVSAGDRFLWPFFPPLFILFYNFPCKQLPWPCA